MKKINKFIYLLSPNTIKDLNFYRDLELVLKSTKVSHFQLRLKKEKPNKIVKIGKIIRKICNKHGVKFLVNDNPLIAKKIMQMDATWANQIWI